MTVRCTSIAKKHLNRLLNDHRSNVVLFSVEGGGCNGLTYRLEPHIEPKQQFDEEVSIGNGNTLRVCGHSLMYLVGSTIDWQSTWMGSTFQFSNPNISSTCGCGATFTPKPK